MSSSRERSEALQLERKHRRLRRVVIEDRQRKALEHVRSSLGYADDVDPGAYNQATFRLINQRKELDALPEADYVVPALDEWKHWEKMNDWDSRNGVLEDLIGKLRRREATAGEIQFLVIVTRPAWARVIASLRRYGGLDLDPGAEGIHQREEARRVNELDNDELQQIVQHGLMDALVSCPRPFPKRFFPWLKQVLAYRALDHVRSDLTEHDTVLPHDVGIRQVLERVLMHRTDRDAAFFAAPGSPGHSQWIQTLDLPAIFQLADEYAPYARTRSACRRAVERLPDRQRDVIDNHYFKEMTQAQIARERGISDSTVRNSHRGGLRNLRRDDELFLVLEAVGKVRDHARREQMDAGKRAA